MPHMFVLFVKNLAPEVDEDELFKVFYDSFIKILFQFFHRYPSCHEASIQHHKHGGSQGHGYVLFAAEEDRRRALREMDNQPFHGRPIMLKLGRISRMKPRRAERNPIADSMAGTSTQQEAKANTNTNQYVAPEKKPPAIQPSQPQPSPRLGPAPLLSQNSQMPVPFIPTPPPFFFRMPPPMNVFTVGPPAPAGAQQTVPFIAVPMPFNRIMLVPPNQAYPISLSMPASSQQQYSQSIGNPPTSFALTQEQQQIADNSGEVFFPTANPPLMQMMVPPPTLHLPPPLHPLPFSSPQFQLMAPQIPPIRMPLQLASPSPSVSTTTTITSSPQQEKRPPENEAAAEKMIGMFQKLFTPSTATAKQPPTDMAAQKAKEGNKLPKAAGNSNFAPLDDLKNAHPLPSPGEIDPGRQSSLDSCAEATADSEEGELEEIKKEIQAQFGSGMNGTMTESSHNHSPGSRSSGEIEEVIARVITFDEKFVTLVLVGNNVNESEYKTFPIGKLNFDIEVNAYYKCEGYHTGGDFLIDAILKRVERESNEFERIAGADSEKPMKMKKLPFLPSNLPFNFSNSPLGPLLFGGSQTQLPTIPTDIVEQPTTGGRNSQAEVDTSSSLDETLKPEEPAEQDEKENREGNEEKTKQDSQEETKTCTDSTKDTTTKSSALVLTILDGQACMFVPNAGVGQVPLFYVGIDSLEPPVKPGTWYSLPMLAIENMMPDSSTIPTFKLAEKAMPLVADTAPLRTRSANGIVQLLFTATLLAERSPNGLLLCHVEQFPASTKELVVDSHCLLGHLERPVRNAPAQQIGLWCTLRKIPLDGNWWRVVGVATKSARKKQPPIMTTAEAAKNSSTIKMVHMESGKAPANQKVPKEVFEPASYDGLICSQTERFFLVMTPQRQWVARLDKRKCNGENLIGTWINFKCRDDNGRKIVEAFSLIPPKVLAIPTLEHVMLRCNIDIPRPLENSTEQPFCPSLGVSPADTHHFLRQWHHGRRVFATIGCAVRMDNELNEDGAEYVQDPLRWEILYVEEPGQ